MHRYRSANLCREEIVALRLYTGPMYVKYNAVLRGWPAGELRALKGNRYTTTIHAVVSGLLKLQKVTVVARDHKVRCGGGGSWGNGEQCWSGVGLTCEASSATYVLERQDVADEGAVEGAAGWASHLESALKSLEYALKSLEYALASCSLHGDCAGVQVFRGMSGMRLPDQFWKKDEFGCRGGVEFGLLSTTAKRHVAMQYAGEGAQPMILEIK